jgi:hypothetical protein
MRLGYLEMRSTAGRSAVLEVWSGAPGRTEAQDAACGRVLPDEGGRNQAVAFLLWAAQALGA